jgi:cytidylate kinase
MGLIEGGARRGFVVAIDGPAGAGKSTVAGHLAQRFGLLNLETGAMYRALALKALRTGTDVDDGVAVLRLTEATRITLEPATGSNRVLLDGVEVTGEVRTPEVTLSASRVSVHGPVRAWMVKAQRSLGLASEAGVVMEGRDIGTVVFPEAAVKLFLEASVEARGERRFAQQPEAGESKEIVLKELRERDTRDRSREQSPLRPADDAILLDTTAISLAEVLQRTEAIVSSALMGR